jgi:hypothetical protein
MQTMENGITIDKNSAFLKIVNLRINQLYEEKEQAGDHKDYVAALMAYGAIIQLEKLRREIEGLGNIHESR